MADSKNEFDVAKSVSDLLTGLKKEQQERVLRWVAEILEIDVSKSTAHQARHEPPTATQIHSDEHGVPQQPVRKPTERAPDIKSFIATKNPKSDVQYAAVVAYYYRFEAQESDRKESITSEVLQQSTRLAGRKRLEKPIMTLNNAKNLGYLDSAARGEFRINTVGENLVAMTLPGQEANATAAARREGKKA